MAVDLKAFFNVEDATVQEANEILRPYEKLLPIKVEGNDIMLPENNSLWRGLQFWGLMTGEVLIDFGLYCIAGTCKNCKSRIKRPGAADRESVLLCQTPVQEGLEILRLAPGFVYRKKRY